MNYLEELEKLSKLKENGIITDEEFVKAKSKILDKMDDNKIEVYTPIKEKPKLKLNKKKILIFSSIIFTLLVLIGVVLYFTQRNNEEKLAYKKIIDFRKYYPVEKIQASSDNMDTLMFLLERHYDLTLNFINKYQNSNNIDEVKKWNTNVEEVLPTWRQVHLLIKKIYGPLNNEIENLNQINSIMNSYTLEDVKKVNLEKIKNTNLVKNVQTMFHRYTKKLIIEMEKILIIELNNQTFYEPINTQTSNMVQNEFNWSKVIGASSEKISIKRESETNPLWSLEAITIVEVQKSSNLGTKLLDSFTGGLFSFSGSEGKVHVKTKSMIEYNKSYQNFSIHIVSMNMVSDKTTN